MLVFVTGKSGSGKSTFSKKLAQKLGYHYVDIDSIGHEVYDDKEIMSEAVSLFGNEIFDEDGSFNRKKLGKIFFEEKDSQRVKYFSNLTWQYMSNRIDSIMQEKNVVVDWVLLPSTDYWAEESFKILIKESSQEVRFQKLLERDHVNLEYLKLRDSAGISYEEYSFNLVFQNDYKVESMDKFVDEAYESIQSFIRDNLFGFKGSEPDFEYDEEDVFDDYVDMPGREL